MKRIIGFVVGLVFTFAIGAPSVLAADFRIAKGEENITVSAGEEVRNLYTAGNLVTINADVQKSLYAAGSAVTISGDVEDNLFIGGGTVIVRGNVGGSLHVGGGTVTIEGKIADDLFIGGGTVLVGESASVGGDLIVGAGTIRVLGPIEGDILMGAGQATIDSRVGGSIKAEVESLTLGDRAVVGGDIAYKSPSEASVSEAASVSGVIDYEYSERRDASAFDFPNKKTLFYLTSIGFVIKLLTSIIVGLVLVYLLGKMTTKVVSKSLAGFWPSLGLGFAALFLVPIVSLILAITVIGAWLGVLIIFAYLMMILLSVAMASVVFGVWLMKVITNQSKYVLDWKAVVLGVLAINIVTFLPFVGWVVMFVFMLVSMGSLYGLAYKHFGGKK